MKTLKKFRLTSFAVTVVTLIMIPTAIAGEDTVISGAMIQAGWCTQGNYICLFWHYVGISVSFIVVCFVLDLIINKWFLKKRQLRKPKSKNANEKEVIDTKPSKDNLAYGMGLAIQQFKKQFNSIKIGSAEGMEVPQLAARNILKTIIDEYLPQSNVVFDNSSLIEQKVYELGNKFDEYNTQLGAFATAKSFAWESHKGTVEPHKGLGESLKRLQLILWGTGEESLKVPINSLVDELTQLLRQERGIK